MLDASAVQLHGMAEVETRVVMQEIHSSNKSDARLAMALLEKLGVFERGKELERGEREPTWAGEVRVQTEEEALEETVDAVVSSAEAKLKRLGEGCNGS